MAVVDSPADDPEKSDRSIPSLPPALAAIGVRLVDAPILLLVCFHQAMLAELDELRRMALVAADEQAGGNAVSLAVEISRRFEFLKRVYEYHCTVEDEVIFHDMEKHVKNVASAYSLEHESINAHFTSVLHSMKMLPGQTSSQVLHEVAICIGILHSSISRHMMKEEEQVFPLLLRHFSFEEQASLVWRFIGSIPVRLLEEFLPWMISFFNPKDKKDVMDCITKVIPEDKPLQKVLISWLGKCEESIVCGSYADNGKGFSSLVRFTDSKDASKVDICSNPPGKYGHKNKIQESCTNSGNNLLDGLYLWHAAIIKDLNGILGELHQIKRSSCFSSLDCLFVRLKFLADILLFYSKGMESVVLPHLSKRASIPLSPWAGLIIDHIKSIQQRLHSITQNEKNSLQFVETLCQDVEAFVVDASKVFLFQETEVFPIVIRFCSNEMQQWLLYTSLAMMPLGLLKCVVTWFSSCLFEHEYVPILHLLSKKKYLADNSFLSLLLEWSYKSYSGKMSFESFERDLESVFKNRCSSLCSSLEVDGGPSTIFLDIRLENRFKLPLIEPIDSKKKQKNPVFSSLIGTNPTKMYEASYSSGVNLRILFPDTVRRFLSPSKISCENSCLDSFCDESSPVDLVFFFHKAVKRELECLIPMSSQLAENSALVSEFYKRCKLFKLLHEIHSDAEDEIAFPALEAKGKFENISRSYTIDHKLDAEYFDKIFVIIEEIHELHVSFSSISATVLDPRPVKLQKLCASLHYTLQLMDRLISDHVKREESELWTLFREHVSLEEQEKIVGRMLGRTKAEMLQDMIPWLMVSLTSEEQQTIMSLLLKITRNTKFVEWLREWWDGEYVGNTLEKLNVSPSSADPLEVISEYLSQGILQIGGTIRVDSCGNNLVGSEAGLPVDNVDEEKYSSMHENDDECTQCTKLFSSSEKRHKEQIILTGNDDLQGKSLLVKYLSTMTQEDMEAALRKVSMDTILEPEKKSYLMQNLIMSRWIVKQQTTAQEIILNTGEKVPEQYPSYRDSARKIFGCKHYKRNCKLVAGCCNHLYTCIRCHDEAEDHSLDRRSVTKMMCMHCLKIQLIGPACSTVSCNCLCMARYYCRICKLFDDEREIYHCPYCNICRVGKGLGIDYYHCMKCNACMSRFLLAHTCRDKCFEDKCPICHEEIFTSSSPVKALSCGHLMHSSCFQDYTCTNYTCPICSKSLGDMQVYFKMLDALLEEEKLPNEYQGRTQVILCNDCEKRGDAPFHWLYHKCPHCGSYNTRLL